MKIADAANMAARHLPIGWQVNLSIERGAGWIDLWNEDGDKVEFPTSPDKDLAEQISDAVDHALACEGLPPVSALETSALPPYCEKCGFGHDTGNPCPSLNR
jgi:hypothetical protein